MKLNLDDVFDLMRPHRLTLVIDGQDHILRPPTLAELRRLAEIDRPVKTEAAGGDADATDDADRAFIATLFDGDAPAWLLAPRTSLPSDEARIELTMKTLILLEAIGAYVASLSPGKRLASGREAIAGALAGAN